ncbi:putative kinetochore protein SPC24 [Cytospora mali]|uniref:Kinetochore protein Spc24 n=1 Tax=Cytospora mali TaxID=578113 RepID=A0A194UZ57_CYTMA|nr:putative kinetochore protein SPC24 [Valsa mali var. pyri (nom. inval.)]
MLLEEDPATLIHHTTANFSVHPDKAAVARVNDSISTLQQARELRMKEAENALRKLSRQLSTMQSQHQELAASDLEMETERLSGQLADLNARLQELELQGVEGADGGGRDPVEDEVLLRLKVYRSLGIDIERDEKDGDFSRAVVRNDRKGDVHVVNLDKKFSRFFYANYFWQTL